MRGLLTAMLLTGCGSDFAGPWQGTLSHAGSCSDGSSGRVTSEANWAISVSRRRLDIATVGNCGELTAEVLADNPNKARLQAVRCGDFSDDAGYRYALYFEGGWIDHERGALGVTIDTEGDYYLGSATTKSGTCRGVFTGRLLRP